MITDAWQSGSEKINKLLTSLSDEDLEMEIAPGKNKAKLIVALLAAMNDSTINVLNIGEIINPDVFNYFKNDDRTLPIPATTKEIRQYWLTSYQWINSKIKDFTPDDWFEKHSAISKEDFEKQPERNKLNVILNRAQKMEYFSGQLVLLSKK